MDGGTDRRTNGRSECNVEGPQKWTDVMNELCPWAVVRMESVRRKARRQEAKLSLG